MNAPAQLIADLQRTRLMPFVIKVFETLHPGESVLEAAPYLKALCYALEQVAAGDDTRLMVAMPPRHLKSITTSVAFVAWVLGRNPAKKIMVASYSQNLARKHSEDTRTVLESDWYQRLFPAARIRDGGNRQDEFLTTHGGGRKAISLGGTTTGFGADLIIVDDLMKADDVNSVAAREEARRWFDNTLMTRLNDKDKGAI